MRKLNLRIIAFLLILVFVQKLGVRLWLHTRLHENNPVHTSSIPNVDHSQIKCDCIDDLMMPMEGTHSFEFTSPPRIYSVFFDTYYSYHPSSINLFSSLRGPPSTKSAVA
jgi:hypothetical protein